VHSARALASNPATSFRATLFVKRLTPPPKFGDTWSVPERPSGRHKRLRLLSLVAGLALLIPAAWPSDATAEFKKWYSGQLSKVKTAFAKKDIGFFQRSTSATFTYVDANGRKKNRGQAIQELKRMMDSCASIEYSGKVVSAKVSGNAARVEVSETYRNVLAPTPDRKKHVMVSVGKVRESWTKSGGRWLLAKIEELGPSKVTLDGKPFHPRELPPMEIDPGRGGG
jgi:hypothetical protein